MRYKMLRALSFGAAGGVVLFAFNVIWAMLRPIPSSLSWGGFVQAQLLVCLASAIVLFVGALVGFGAIRSATTTAPVAFLLGALAAIPAAFTASALAVELGIAGAIASAMIVAAVISFVGGGGLHGAVSHG